MNSSVDFTERRKFSSNWGSNNRLRSFLAFSSNDLKYPWAKNMYQITRTLDRNNNYEKLLNTGNKSERKYSRDEKTYMNGKICERCGYNMRLKPWLLRTSLLCPKCDKAIDRPDSFWLNVREHKVKIRKV